MTSKAGKVNFKIKLNNRKKKEKPISSLLSGTTLVSACSVVAMSPLSAVLRQPCCCCCCCVASVVSDSVRPHRRQPTRPRRPWDSPGKNVGVGCHFLLQCMKVKSESEGAQSCPTLIDPMDCSPPGSSVHGIFQAAPNTGKINQSFWCTG